MTKFDLPELKTVNFDGARHYLTPSGKKYPSITSMLSYFKKDAISEWRERVGEKEANKIMKMAAARGTAVHDLLEQHIKGEKITSHSTNPFYYSMFVPVRRFLNDNLVEAWCLETPLYSDALKLGGRCDLIGKLNEPVIIDFKTSIKAKKEEWIEDYFIQASAYALMFKERTGVVINKFCILIVDEDGRLNTFYGSCSEHFPRLIELRKQYPL